MKKVIGIVVVMIVAVCCTAFSLRRHTNHLTASGVLEARNISVGSKIGGRISRVHVSEGDHVQPDQILVDFDSAELEAQLIQAKGRVDLARADLDKMLHGSRREDIAEANAASEGYRKAELAQAQADLERARTDEENASRELKRAEALTAGGAASQQSLDNARDRERAARALVQSQINAVSAADGRLKAAEAVAEKAHRGFRAEEIAAARAELQLSEGQLKEAEARWAEREVRAPASAVVESLDLRPGDLLSANAPVARLLEADQLYLMVYVPETKIGQVAVGKPAELTVDTYPGEKFTATVEQIRQQAEFLPRNIQTKEERAHQVIGVRLRMKNTDGRLRAGISADVDFGLEKP
jgi:HlyD family secretion protein